jgi:hypothetical protein
MWCAEPRCGLLVSPSLLACVASVMRGFLAADQYVFDRVSDLAHQMRHTSSDLACEVASQMAPMQDARGSEFTFNTASAFQGGVVDTSSRAQSSGGGAQQQSKQRNQKQKGGKKRR